jgi:hypothetical protein
MKRELIAAAPIRDALAEIGRLEVNARAVYAQGTAESLKDVYDMLERALQDAENPDIGDGISAQEYADAHGISLSAAYKRFDRAEKKGRPIAKKQPDGWRVLKIAS